jgi:hypothetical protein
MTSLIDDQVRNMIRSPPREQLSDQICRTLNSHVHAQLAWPVRDHVNMSAWRLWDQIGESHDD